MSSHDTATVPDWPVGYRVRRALELADLDVEVVARALGVTKSTVYNYMSGHSRPRRAALSVIAEMTGVALWWLEGREPTDADTGSATRGYQELDLFAHAA